MNLRCAGGSSTILSRALKACRGDHVGLVDDVDLEAVPDRGEEGPFAQVAGVVDTAVAGRVDLDDVEGPEPPRASSTQLGHLPHGVAVGPRRSSGSGRGCGPTVVLPQPRGPEKR